MIDNIIQLSLVSLSYIVIIFGLAFVMLRGIVVVKTFFDNVLLYFIVGNFYVMNAIFLLLFLKCTSRIITIIVLLTGAVAVRYFLDKSKFKKVVLERVKVFALLSEGVYGWKLFRKEKVKHLWKRIENRITLLLKLHFVETIVFIACMAIHAYYIGYRFVKYSGFGIYDEVVHLEWVQNMLQGQIFSDGVYPFGMHNILYALIKVFGFKAFIVARYFGFILVMFSLVMLYVLLKRVYRSKYAPLIGLFLYAAANLFRYSAWDRLQYTIPEEFGILFLYPVFIYLHYYISDKKQMNLVLFGMSFSLTLYIHYYVTLVALLVCLSVFLSRFYTIFKEKLFVKIIVCGLISTMVGMLPIGIGMATGHELQGSLYWAVGVITDSSDQDEGNNEIVYEETNTPEVTLGGSKIAGNIFSKATIIKDKAIEYLIREKVFWFLLISMFLVFINIVMRNLYRITKRQTFLQFCILLYVCILMESKGITYIMRQEVFWIIIISMLIIMIITIIRNLCTTLEEETFLQYSVLIYISILLVMLTSKELGLPTIIEDYRVSVFLAYAIPLLLGMPLEIVYEVFNTNKWTKILISTISVGVIGIMVCGIYLGDYKRELSRFVLLQAESSVAVVDKIFEEYDDNSWTIVSTVSEYSIILDSGFHYEWTDFLAKLENFDKNTSIFIPTENVFFFVEKRPIVYGELITIGEEIETFPNFTLDDAKEVILNKDFEQISHYYSNQRSPIMAKAYHWAKMYMYYFPNEMSVYYEDDDFVCYHLEQEPYYLNNLAINYGFNVN
ncbi:MAG: hypothetical protein ACOWWH_04075 [Eubacteriaceae bacterium]